MTTPGTSRDGAEVPDERLKELPKWADRYARNRTLPALLFFTLFFGYLAIFVLLGNAVRSAFGAGQPGLAMALSVLFVAAMAGWVWAALSGAMKRLANVLVQRSYEREGVAVAKGVQPARETWRSWIGGGALLTAPVVGWLLPVEAQFAQPIVACYTVPLLLWWVATDGRVTLPMGLLWPGLYAVHAVAMVLGAPLVIGADAGQTVIWPLVLYLLVALLAGHIYSRYALSRMREISHDVADEEAE